MSEDKIHQIAQAPKPLKVSSLEHVKSQRKWNLERLNKAFLRGNQKRFFDFLTLGTGNKKPAELIELLKLPIFSCNYLVDIRSNPNSRHTPYWNRNNISELCRAASITYVHRPNLGVPSNVRRLLYSGQMSYEQFFSWYDTTILNKANLEEVAEIIKDKNSAFMCTEIGPKFCHRHRLALKLEESHGYISFDL